MIFVYLLSLIFLSIYSYFLIDPNLTFFQTDWWVSFRNMVVDQGYYHRDTSWLIYLVLVIALFLLHYFFVKNYKKVNPIKIVLLTALILIISYPFLSHDFFNYMFDARILTFYHANPYIHKALDFPSDHWLRFMQWTHRPYPYGPIFLLITLVPSVLALGKFVLNFFLFKLTFAIFYWLAVYFMQKIGKKWAVIIATHPLILLEGLVSSHNDLIAMSLAIIGIVLVFNKTNLRARLFLLLSAGIKYMTLPIIFISKNNKSLTKIAFVGMLLVIAYLSIKSEAQPWYFLNIFIFLPYFEKFIRNLNILFFGLLVSYYPYIRLGGWDSAEKINLKHEILIAAVLLNVVWLVISYRKTLIKNLVSNS